jgi:hypothetical protein
MWELLLDDKKQGVYDTYAEAKMEAKKTRSKKIEIRLAVKEDQPDLEISERLPGWPENLTVTKGKK